MNATPSACQQPLSMPAGPLLVLRTTNLADLGSAIFMPDHMAIAAGNKESFSCDPHGLDAHSG